MDFGGKDYKTFGLDGHTFDRRCIFLFKEGDNNYSISSNNCATFGLYFEGIFITLNIILLKKPARYRGTIHIFLSQNYGFINIT